MAEKVKYTGKLTKAELDKLIAEHKTVYTLKVPVNDQATEVAMCYLKPIDRVFMGAILAQKDLVKQREMMLEALWLTGDDRIKKEDELFFSAMNSLGELLYFRHAELKKN